MIDEQAIVMKDISLFEWKNSSVSNYLLILNQKSNKNQNSDKPQHRTAENIVKLFFCPVTKEEQKKLTSIKINGGVGEMLLDPKTEKISIIKLFEDKLSCHTLDYIETYNGLSPMHITCVYEKSSDSLKIYLIDKNKCRNLTCSLANEENFGHDIILDIDKNGRICGIEVFDASEYFT